MDYFDDIEFKSKEHHKSNGGVPLCDAPIVGVIALYTDDFLVTCPKCLQKMREEKSNES